MEILVAIIIGSLTAVGTYLMLRMRTFPVIVGLSLLAYAVNFFLFASGRLMLNAPPLLYTDAPHTDALPQALTLTAIVIAFGMTAVAVIMALAAYLNDGSDKLDMENAAPEVTPEERGQ
ncbi:Na(+)/H(+) antiporter subunit C [Roseibaca ekhonensis]|jgi:multicomponent K+:H+ antiporter subunit C|uniref:Na(+)/H(+) antiporter subunit C n=1 Tax=Roseinatronobacter ekhonensis TaxID=254356 RepID=A0A3B0MHC8_9RHOB|nr:Na+/H+ antiporter subunit C [Roseibaca ekhonensis]SUZ32918.1 Na(+)/H(+) antiporter subunit C [Roseibaca ekhonensis]